MKLSAIDLVQLAIPAGGEDQARGFYCELLGLAEVPKPPEVSRDGAWFENDTVRVHVGAEADFVPAKHAHPAFVVEDIDALLAACAARKVLIKPSQTLAGRRGFHSFDPFGNRIELVEKI